MYYLPFMKFYMIVRRLFQSNGVLILIYQECFIMILVFLQLFKTFSNFKFHNSQRIAYNLFTALMQCVRKSVQALIFCQMCFFITIEMRENI